MQDLSEMTQRCELFVHYQKRGPHCTRPNTLKKVGHPCSWPKYDEQRELFANGQNMMKGWGEGAVTKDSNMIKRGGCVLQIYDQNMMNGEGVLQKTQIIMMKRGRGALQMIQIQWKWGVYQKGSFPLCTTFGALARVTPLYTIWVIDLQTYYSLTHLGDWQRPPPLHPIGSLARPFASLRSLISLAKELWNYSYGPYNRF